MSEERVTFRGLDGEDIPGHLVMPATLPTPAPAVIVIHEIWGLDAHILDVARRFAAQGYIGFAPQLYTGAMAEAMTPARIMAGMQVLRNAPPEVQRDPERLQATWGDRSPEEQQALTTLIKVMSPATRAQFARDVSGAVRFLAARPEVDSRRIACLGFCMGGGITANVATLVPDLWKAVIFYGENPPLDRVPAINSQVLGLYGEADPRITDTVPSLAEAMAAHGKSFAYQVYPGAPHAFFNDTRDATYRPEAAQDAWRRVLDFLGKP
ncbi:MAG: dienelactone hydrolase family protein [Thermaerobacter sp.]|nr:dienelactone hydrolase family protein [Thermaerobacter sp.]